MAAHLPQRARLGRLMAASPIRGFALRALLWLPLSFYIWFAFASTLTWPVVQMT